MSSSLQKNSMNEKQPSQEKKLQEKNGENNSSSPSKEKEASSVAVIKIQLSVSF